MQYTVPEKKCNTLKDKFIVLQIDVTGCLSLQELTTTNSDQMKHTCHSKGCPNSYINTQCSPFLWLCRHAFLHANGHKGTECHHAIDCPKCLAPVVQFGHLNGVTLYACRKLDRHPWIAAHVRHNVPVVSLLSAVVCETFPRPQTWFWMAAQYRCTSRS